MNGSLLGGQGEITSYANTQALSNMVLWRTDIHCSGGLPGQAVGKEVGEASPKGFREALVGHEEEFEPGLHAMWGVGGT